MPEALPRATASSAARSAGQTSSRPASGRRPTARRPARSAKVLPPPVLAEVRRGDIVESRHRGHVAQVGADGRLEQGIGDPDIEVTLRSAVKPFALTALVDSGAADDLRLSPAELAVMAASHTGEDMHVRTLQAVFRRAGVSQSLLTCGTAGMPLDAVTAARLARDGEMPGPIRHMCSGFHAASILLSRYSDWSLDDYDRPDHPSQVATRAAVARVFGRRPATLRTAIDDCGLATFAFPLVDIARAFALLADPSGVVTDPARSAMAPALVRIRDAMMAAPEMIGGNGDVLDTRLMRVKPNRLVAKGGAEGLRGVGLLPGSRGPDGGTAGLAVRIEDGDGFARAARSVTVEALHQLGVLSEVESRALAAHHRPQVRSTAGVLLAQTVPGFVLAPISELV
ncbi:MAG: asparaginase [Chloroflexota bacterium]|nr:asparaginase [Chloroflexota bacterium]